MKRLLQKAVEKALSLVGKRDKILGFTIVLVTEKHYIELWRHKKKSALLIDHKVHGPTNTIMNPPIELDENGEEIPKA
jgi:hypothetical protein